MPYLALTAIIKVWFTQIYCDVTVVFLDPLISQAYVWEIWLLKPDSSIKTKSSS